jgi:hypothetical protein
VEEYDPQFEQELRQFALNLEANTSRIPPVRLVPNCSKSWISKYQEKLKAQTSTGTSKSATKNTKSNQAGSNASATAPSTDLNRK